MIVCYKPSCRRYLAQFNIITCVSTAGLNTMLQANADTQLGLSQKPTDHTAALAKVAELVSSSCQADEFYQRALTICQQQLDAAIGCLWTISASSGPTSKPGLVLSACSNGAVEALHPNDEASCRHKALLEQACGGLTPVSVASADVFNGAGNPLPGSITFAPVTTGRRSIGLLELVTKSPIDQAGMQFLEAATECFAVFCDEQRVEELAGRNTQLQKLCGFVDLLQRHSDLNATCLVVVNEAKSLIGCDRMTITVGRGVNQRVAAISGQESISHRSATVQTLNELASAVAEKNQAVSSFETTTHSGSPELQRQLEHAEATAIAAWPLSVDEPTTTTAHAYAEGILVAEWFATPTEPPNDTIVEPVVRHSALALRNAIEATNQRFPSLFRRNKAGGSVRLWMIGSLLLLGCFFIPANFVVEAHGDIQPANRRHVFAPRDGVVAELLIDDGADVDSQQPLLRISDATLDLEFSRVDGEIQTNSQKLAALNASLAMTGRRGQADAGAIAADAEELVKYLAGLEQQRTILQQQQQLLTLRSPICGTALTWNLRQRLESRPVQRGETLLTVAETNGPWVLELLVADDDFGAIRDAVRDSESYVPVRFSVSTHPARSFVGTIESIGKTTEIDEIAGPVVHVTVAVDRTNMPELRPGTTVVADIECGRQPLGYVWLHDIIDPIRAMFVF